MPHDNGADRTEPPPEGDATALPNLPTRRVTGDALSANYYEAAVAALRQCDSIDECKHIADKHAALASYAKQAKDNRLQTLALRIRARAIRRCGELIKECAGSWPGRPAKTRKAALTNSRRQAGVEAGLSLHQTRTALRLASIPEAVFNEKVQAASPPTLTKFAEYGTQSRKGVATRWRQRQMEQDGLGEQRAVVEKLGPKHVEEFENLTMAGEVLRLAELCREHDASRVGASIRDAAAIRGAVETIRVWLDTLEVSLR